jgi:hypothetical protein
VPSPPARTTAFKAGEIDAYSRSSPISSSGRQRIICIAASPGTPARRRRGGLQKTVSQKMEKLALFEKPRQSYRDILQLVFVFGYF